MYTEEEDCIVYCDAVVKSFEKNLEERKIKSIYSEVIYVTKAIICNLLTLQITLSIVQLHKNPSCYRHNFSTHR